MEHDPRFTTGRDQRPAALAVAAAVFAALLLAVYLAALMTDFTFDLTQPVYLGRAFNSMLAHMLHGQVDVDPEAIGLEGFARDGRVYAYFGPFCALLRLPLLAIPGGLEHDVTILSCTTALLVAALTKASVVRRLHRHAPRGPATTALTSALLLYTVLGAPITSFARPSIFQEVASWAYALATLFVAGAFAGLLERRFSTARLAGLAAFAGAALLTRATQGLGLFAALALLLLTLWATERRPGGAAGWVRAALSRRYLLPASVALAMVAAFLILNELRWGNPLVSQPTTLQLMNTKYPDRLIRGQQFALFDLRRAPFCLLYYFAPLWPLIPPASGFLSDTVQLFDQVELPPSSFFATDLLPIVLVVASIRARPRAWPFPRLQAASVGLGLAVTPLFMLTAFALAYRYRLDFYPSLDFAGFLAAASLAASRVNPRPLAARTIWAATIFSVLAAHGMLLLYKTSAFGPAQEVLQGRDVFHYFYWRAYHVL